MIINESRSSVPFPFALNFPYFLSEYDTVLLSSSNLYQYVSINHSKHYLCKKLHLADIYLIDFTARFRAFQKLPKHLHLWASKLFCNFVGTSRHMFQQGLWLLDLCCYCNLVPEANTVHILTCECSILSEYRDSIMEAFCSNCTRLDRDEKVIDLLLSFIVNSPSAPSPNLCSLHSKLS